MLALLHHAISKRLLAMAAGIALSWPALQAQPTVDIGLYPGPTDGVVEVRLRANGDFNQLLSSLVFTISWPASSGVTLDDGQLTSLCSAIPIAPNGDGMQQSGGMRYQTYFMLGLQSLAPPCPLVSGQDLPVMRIPISGLTSGCVDLNIVNDAYTASHNKNYYVSLNGLDKTGVIWSDAVSECTCTAMRLDITTDGQPQETGWTIRDASTGLVVFSDTLRPWQTNRTVHENFCLTQGCYWLQVTDAGGNGISGGGYVLHQGSDRFIDANGSFGAVSQIAENHTFCLPLGPTYLKPPFCDLTDIGLNDILRARKITGADKYNFEIFDPHGSFDKVVSRNGPSLKISNGIWNAVPHDMDLNIRVSARTGGVFSSYGKVCKARFGAAPGMATGVDEQISDSEEDLVIQPNPTADGAFRLLYDSGEEGQDQATIELYSTTGQRLSMRQERFEGRLDVRMQLPADAASGLYMLVLTTSTERLTRLVAKP